MVHFRTPLNLAFLAILVLATLAGLVLIPTGADIAVRWGLDLSVTATMPKLLGLAQMPIATAVIWAVFWVIGRYGNRERQVGQARALDLALTGLTGLFAAFQVLIVVIAR